MSLTVDYLYELLLDGRGRYDGDEVVDDLAHALQTAELAREAGADKDLVAGALLHDIGHHPDLNKLYPLTPHERIAAQVLEPIIGERGAWVVGQHVEAKRHLATEPSYAESLSESSTLSLARQGGPKVLSHLETGWGPLALELRRWDDQAKVIGAPEPDWPALVEYLGY